MSTTFKDGPAAGHRLSLSRCPIMLRVTVNGPKVDALDLLTDTAVPDERLVLYVLEDHPSVAFVDGRDKAGRRWGRQMAVARYAMCAEQPDDAVMRDNARWRDWCAANGRRLLPGWARDKRVEVPDATEQKS